MVNNYNIINIWQTYLVNIIVFANSWFMDRDTLQQKLSHLSQVFGVGYMNQKKNYTESDT